MESEKNREKLFKEFPPIAISTWEDKIREDLKGADPEKLVWQTPDGISVQPFYSREDINGLNFIKSIPGEYPCVRGYNSEGNNWEIVQDIIVSSFQDANQKALSLLGKGVTSPGFILKTIPSGLRQLEELLNGFDLRNVPLRFSLPGNDHTLLKLIHELAAKKEVDPSDIKGSVKLDPLGHLIRTGNFYKDEKTDLHDLKNALSFGNKYLPRIRLLTVSPSVFHNSGASVSQDLALAMSAGTYYMSELTGMGLSAFEVASKLSFHFAIGTGYFPEIAKLRAARLIWAVISDSFSPGLAGSCKMRIDCSTSAWDQTINGQYNNLLRGTTQSMSAIIGGADSLLVLPYDNASANSTEFSERLARNIQLILREEAYFNKVADPGAGSYYIEKLTDKIAEKAWNLFVDIESAGGLPGAFRKGIIQDMIENSAREKQSRIENKVDKIVGVNYYPDPAEKLPSDLKEQKHGISSGSILNIRPVSESRATMEYEKHILNET